MAFFQLLRYLRPEYAVYHVRGVNLVWQLENAGPRSHVEAVLSQSLASPQSRNNHGAYEAFGVLWRLTGRFAHMGATFFELTRFPRRQPASWIPVQGSNDDHFGHPQERRHGDSTHRRDVDAVQSEVVPTVSRLLTGPSAGLITTTRILDPILFDLLDPSVRRSRSATKINDRELQDFTYDAPMNQRLINHLLDTLLSVVRFGGQGFVKVANSTPIRRSLHSGLVRRVENCKWGAIR